MAGNIQLVVHPREDQHADAQQHSSASPSVAKSLESEENGKLLSTIYNLPIPVIKKKFDRVSFLALSLVCLAALVIYVYFAAIDYSETAWQYGVSTISSMSVPTIEICALNAIDLIVPYNYAAVQFVSSTSTYTIVSSSISSTSTNTTACVKGSSSTADCNLFSSSACPDDCSVVTVEQNCLSFDPSNLTAFTSTSDYFGASFYVYRIESYISSGDVAFLRSSARLQFPNDYVVVKLAVPFFENTNYYLTEELYSPLAGGGGYSHSTTAIGSPASVSSCTAVFANGSTYSPSASCYLVQFIIQPASFFLSSYTEARLLSLLQIFGVIAGVAGTVGSFLLFWFPLVSSDRSCLLRSVMDVDRLAEKKKEEDLHTPVSLHGAAKTANPSSGAPSSSTHSKPVVRKKVVARGGGKKAHSEVERKKQPLLTTTESLHASSEYSASHTEHPASHNDASFSSPTDHREAHKSPSQPLHSKPAAASHLLVPSSSSAVNPVSSKAEAASSHLPVPSSSSAVNTISSKSESSVHPSLAPSSNAHRRAPGPIQTASTPTAEVSVSGHESHSLTPPGSATAGGESGQTTPKPHSSAHSHRRTRRPKLPTTTSIQASSQGVAI